MTNTPSVRVVKIGGRAQSSAALPAAVAAAWRAAPGALCLVHGGGDEVSALQRQLGHTPTFVGGRRVTSDADIALLRMTLSGDVTTPLVAQLGALGLPALGHSGEDGGLLAARPLDARVLGRAGAVERVDASLLRPLLTGGYLPVISPLARDAGDDQAGAALNVNGDDAAAAIAIALEARELLLVADVPGVLVQGEPVETMEAGEAAAAVAAGVASGGMAAKLQAALAALDGGVEQVRIGDVGALADAGRGTVLLPSRSLV
jgi:acetylglutamate kinase